MLGPTLTREAIALLPYALEWIKAVTSGNDEAAKLATVRALRASKRRAVKAALK